MVMVYYSYVVTFFLVSLPLIGADDTSCSLQRDKFFQCMRDLHTSTDARLLKDKNQVVAQQCGISQTSVQCWRIKDTCQNEAEQTAESSDVKKLALKDDNACWRNVQLTDDAAEDPANPKFRRSSPGSGLGGPPPGNDPMTPAECLPPYDPQIAACTINLLQKDQQFIAANARMRQKAKQCQDEWPQECKPSNPVLAHCLVKAYEKVTNLTVVYYRICMEQSGYQLPMSNNSGRAKQIFPLSNDDDK